MPPWVNVMISIVVVLLGVGGNLAVVSFFLGKMRGQLDGQRQLMEAHQAFTKQIVDSLLSRMADADQFFTQSHSGQAELRARMEHVERNTNGLQSLREEVARIGARFQAHHEQSQEETRRINMGVESLQRQMGNLVARGINGIIEMPSGGAEVKK